MENFISGMIGYIVGAIYVDRMYRKRWNEYERKMTILYKRAQIRAGEKADGRWK